MVDGDIRRCPDQAPAKGKGRRKDGYTTATLKAVREMPPARTEIIICTGLKTRGGVQIWGDRSRPSLRPQAERLTAPFLDVLPSARGKPVPAAEPVARCEPCSRRHRESSGAFRGIPLWDPSWTVIEIATGTCHGTYDSEIEVAACFAFAKLSRDEVEVIADISPMAGIAALPWR